MKRGVKRIFIIFVYVAIVGSIVGCTWYVNRPLPTCIDGKKNGTETDVDCGGSCGACPEAILAKDLDVKDAHVVFGGVGRYDVVATVKNPNPLYGAAVVHYTISLTAGRDVLVQKQGTGFILPSQERYFVATNLETVTTPSNAKITIDSVEWVRFTDFDDPDFLVQNIRYGLVRGGVNYAEAFALVRNNSTFDFAEVTAYVVIKDGRGVPIALNTTTLGNVEARSERDFKLSWPYRFPGTMADIDIAVYANVFDSQNFVEQYLPGGRFEQLR